MSKISESKTMPPKTEREKDCAELYAFLKAVSEGEIPTEAWLKILLECLNRLEADKYVYDQIKIGKYALVRGLYPDLWMQHEDGEGMEVSPELEKRLNDYLDDFWKENF
jgi:hypothetical protein